MPDPVIQLRCTRKLLDHLKLEPPVDSPADTAPLGRWCATLLTHRRRAYVACINDPTLLPLFLAAQPEVFPSRFPQFAGTVLG